jgi:hypothetical protein
MRRAIYLSATLATVLAVAFIPIRAISRSSPTMTSGPSNTAYLGFDRNVYPGDDALPVLRKTFVFAGYWLGPPPGRSLPLSPGE